MSEAEAQDVVEWFNGIKKENHIFKKVAENNLTLDRMIEERDEEITRLRDELQQEQEKYIDLEQKFDNECYTFRQDRKAAEHENEKLGKPMVANFCEFTKLLNGSVCEFSIII
jgi:predicted  nucleic acid-binding Zn-ribbon protein